MPPKPIPGHGQGPAPPSGHGPAPPPGHGPAPPPGHGPAPPPGHGPAPPPGHGPAPPPGPPPGHGPAPPPGHGPAPPPGHGPAPPPGHGDILSGLPKKTQSYFFFQITNVTSFRSQLLQVAPLVTTVAQVLKDRKAIEDHKKKGNTTLLTMVGVNIAFSHKGLATIGIDDSNLTSDNNFLIGQKADAQSLGDKGTGDGANFVPDWDPAFLKDIHGVFLISGDSHGTVNKRLDQVKNIFFVGSSKASIKEVTTIVGDVRPGKLSAHEHFGFLDGISNPSIIGFDNNPNPGPKPVPAGVLVTGHEGDPATTPRPEWAVDGSFFVFRYLFQNVPEFDEYLKANPVPVPGLTREEGSELLGARLVGRWKSGAPIDLAPFKDDPELAADPKRNNNFHFAAERDFQKNCPFAAHVRKTNPRDDLEALTPPISTQKNRIARRGVQFGPEVTKEEKQSGKTSHGRGLLFACYQTSITDAFAFIQKSWANNATFPIGEQAPEVPGLDPLIGQGDRKLSGTDPNNPAKELTMPDFVISRGGEYFFSPSLKGLKKTLAIAP
ncbi:Peroxidase 2 [Hypsizygus marmoreus]|uniref:Peroxidase 2 n=1 Tax=Hypsizygus marmoreus TaxID=39966 RepID=A0A369JL11_HYPMA|nr:Peroxidase 2 [Hypsizygus marmoreus]